MSTGIYETLNNLCNYRGDDYTPGDTQRGTSNYPKYRVIIVRVEGLYKM